MTSTQHRRVLFYRAEHLTELLEDTRHLHLMQHQGSWLSQHSHAQANGLLKVDLQNSVHAIVSAQTTQRMIYTPYGHVFSCSPPSAVGFTGMLFDAAIGGYLLGNGHRAYQPALRRFLSADVLSPFGAGGINAYAYCANDPVNHQDPSGRVRVFNTPFVRPLIKTLMTSGLKTSVPIVLKKKAYIATQLEDARQALFYKRKPALHMSPERQVLDAAFSAYPVERLEPFPRSVQYVNTNLASHGNSRISMEGSRHYAALVTQVQADERSNSGAHLSAAYTWLSKGEATGFLFNVGGALVTGAHDHKNRVLGIRSGR
ncbi:RHS repeat-associated core domain-containing protein [Pseudomonas entomophila]|uniref:RHS repeat-associated core domain-containing protein n=1 Tax=Pseudomonas entomophila TaxID=312306 RepID=UPI0015E2BEA7|nr:RHS repeat-associated core domain-containing protein [Pseudomonas entomophila]MBA1187899.1 RHS repeat-associated core domain-containing protein [Pseudomonas entomophila]